jgi:hypothetical protein
MPTPPECQNAAIPLRKRRESGMGGVISRTSAARAGADRLGARSRDSAPGLWARRRSRMRSAGTSKGPGSRPTHSSAFCMPTRRQSRARPQPSSGGTLDGQLRLLGDLFVLGELVKEEYEAGRSELRAELTRLQEDDAHGRPEVLGRLQLYLLNDGAAWRDAKVHHRSFPRMRLVCRRYQAG